MSLLKEVQKEVSERKEQRSKDFLIALMTVKEIHEDRELLVLELLAENSDEMDIIDEAMELIDQGKVDVDRMFPHKPTPVSADLALHIVESVK